MLLRGAASVPRIDAPAHPPSMLNTMRRAVHGTHAARLLYQFRHRRHPAFTSNMSSAETCCVTTPIFMLMLLMLMMLMLMLPSLVAR